MDIHMDNKALTFGLGIILALVLLGFAMWHTDGPASQCEDAGGQMLVGPGGETSCVSNKTFVPLEGFDGSGKPN
jgi:hypothetical protein